MSMHNLALKDICPCIISPEIWSFENWRRDDPWQTAANPGSSIICCLRESCFLKIMFLDNLKNENFKSRGWISKKVCTQLGVLLNQIHAGRKTFPKNRNWHRTCKISEKESTHNNEGSLSFVVWEESHFFRVKGGGKSDCYRSRPLFVVTCKCLEICGYMSTIAFLKQVH